MITDTAEVVLPLDAYMYGDDTYQTFLRAHAIVRGQCLRRFGVEPQGPTMNYEADSPAFDRRHEGRYGRLSLELARQRGYRAPAEMYSEPDRSGLWEPDETAWFLIAGSAEYPDRPLPVDAYGDPLPADGCNGEALRRLAADDPPRLALPETLANDAYSRAERHSAVVAAMAAWSRCMSRRGYEFETIWDAIEQDWPDPISDEEITTAVADTECRLETNLTGIWFAVESMYQERLIANHIEELTAIKEWLEVLHRNSADVLAGG